MLKKHLRHSCRIDYTPVNPLGLKMCGSPHFHPYFAKNSTQYILSALVALRCATSVYLYFVIFAILRAFSSTSISKCATNFFIVSGISSVGPTVTLNEWDLTSPLVIL